MAIFEQSEISAIMKLFKILYSILEQNNKSPRWAEDHKVEHASTYASGINKKGEIEETLDAGNAKIHWEGNSYYVDYYVPGEWRTMSFESPYEAMRSFVSLVETNFEIRKVLQGI